jgi:hypothetical protein
MEQDIIFTVETRYMAHHYAVDPVDYLLEVAEKLDENVETLPGSIGGDLTTDGVVELLDTEEESVERHGKEAYELLELVNNYDGTPEELARDSEMTRTEFFQYATVLDEQGLVDLDNGSAELTAKGGQIVEGIEYVTQHDKNTGR